MLRLYSSFLILFINIYKKLISTMEKLLDGHENFIENKSTLEKLATNPVTAYYIPNFSEKVKYKQSYPQYLFTNSYNSTKSGHE